MFHHSTVQVLLLVIFVLCLGQLYTRASSHPASFYRLLKKSRASGAIGSHSFDDIVFCFAISVRVLFQVCDKIVHMEGK